MTDTQPTPVQPPYTRPQTYYPPQQWQQPPPYYPPPQPFPQPLPPPVWQQQWRPPRQNVKVAALICWGFAVIIAVAGGASTLIFAGLLNIAVFVLIFFI